MNAHRLIPNNIEPKVTLIGNLPFVGDLVGEASIKDFILAVMAPVFISMFLIESLPPVISSKGPFILLIIAGIGIGVLAAMPRYTSVTGLVSQYLSFKKKPKQARFSDPDTSDEEMETRPWHTSESTIEKTGVKTIHLDEGIIEREDDVMVGAIKVNGMNLDTATNRSVQDATASFSEFVNTSLDFPIQIYLTTRRFNPTNFIEKYEERADDEEIEDNVLLKTYIDHYINRSFSFLSRYLMYREYYVIVPVTRFDVRKESRESGLLNFDAIPGFVGELLAELFGKSDIGKITESQIKRRQIDEVNNRLNKISQVGIGSLNGASAEKLDANEFAALVKEFWEGRDLAFKRDEEFLRETPIVTGPTDREKIKQENGDYQ